MINIDVAALADAIVERMGAPERTEWITVNEAAEHLRCSDKWIRERLGEIPHVRIDGKLLFARQELDSWANRYREGT